MIRVKVDMAEDRLIRSPAVPRANEVGPGAGEAEAGSVG